MKKISSEKTSNAARADAVFKPSPPKAETLSEHALEKVAFDRNRERLKMERLAREELSKRK